MRNLSGLAARVRNFLFGAPDETLTKNENRGGDNVVSLDSVREESPSKENASPDEGLLACSEIEKDKQEEDSSMMNRFPWDIYEAVMLLEAYLEIEKYPQRRSIILKRLSADLRGRAEKKGMKIDATFRNVNGMNLQYERFRYMMTGGRRGFQGPIPKCFIEAKALYEKDRPAYMQTLKDAMPKEEEKVPAPAEVIPEEKPTEEIKEQPKATEAPSAPLRRPWDRWEWALLLEAYEEIQKNPSAKMEILQQLSDTLRTRATRQGMEIDDTFRNLNGMKLQYEQVLYVMTRGEHGLKGNLSKVFTEVKNIYLTDKNWFDMILRKAKKDAGIEVSQEVKKKTPITVVNGEVVKTAPDFSKLPIQEVPHIHLYRNIYGLELSFALRQKLYQSKIQTIQNLIDYMKDNDHGDLSAAECTEIYTKLAKYIDDHKSAGKVDFFGTKSKQEEKDSANPAKEPEQDWTFLTDEEKSSVPKSVWIQNIHNLLLSTDEKRQMYSRSVRSVEDLYFFLKQSREGDTISYETWQTLYQALRKYVAPFLVKKTTKHTEEKVSSPKISLEGVPPYYLSRYLYVLHLSFDVEKKLYSLKLETVQKLSDYMNSSEAGSLPYFDKAEILVKLGTYLDQHRENGIAKKSVVPEKMSSEESHSSIDAKPPEKVAITRQEETKPPVTYTPPEPSPLLVSIQEEPSLFGGEEKPTEKVEEQKKAIGRWKRQVSSLPDLLAMETLENDTPVAFTLQGRRVFVGTWKNLYVHSLKYLLPKYLDAFTSLRTRAMFFDKVFWLVRKSYQRNLRKPVELGQDFYVEIDLSTSTMLNYLKKVLERCEIDIDTFIIETDRLVPTEVSPSSDTKETELTCDLEKEKIYEGLTPHAFSYFGEKQEVQGWDELYTKCASILYEDYPSVFVELRKECEEGDLLHYLSATSDVGRAVKLGDRMYLHMGFTPYRMWSFLRYALVKCQVDFENLVVSFAKVKENPNPAPVVTVPQKDADRPTIEAAPVEIEVQKEPVAISSEETALDSQIQQVLASRFSDGFDPKRINVKKFQKFFAQTYGHQVPMGLGDLLVKIRQVGTVRGDGRIYAKADAEEASALKHIADTLVSLLDREASVVDRDTFYEKYREELARLSIYDASMMEGELAKLLPRGYVCRYRVYHGPVEKEDGEEVLRYIKASLCPILEEDVYDRFWYMPKDKIDKVLKRDDDMLHIKSTWFYYRNISLATDEREKLRQRLHNEIWKKDYLSEDDILGVLQGDFPGIAADVSTFPPAVVRWALPKLYPDDFCIVGSTLTDVAHAGSAAEALRVLCKKHTSLTEDQLKGLREKINFKGNYAGAVMEEMVRISPDEWVRRDQVHFDHTIPRYIAKYMEGKECIPLQEVTGLLEFPNIGVKWNLYVLESYLYKNDGLCPFGLLQAAGGVSAGGAYGAIVKKGGPISKHRDALVYLLARDDAWQTDEEALDRIVTSGLQAERRLKDIHAVAKEARLERNKLKQVSK